MMMQQQPQPQPQLQDLPAPATTDGQGPGHFFPDDIDNIEDRVLPPNPVPQYDMFRTVTGA
jgi:hypothetical protein